MAPTRGAPNGTIKQNDQLPRLLYWLIRRKSLRQELQAGNTGKLSPQPEASWQVDGDRGHRTVGSDRGTCFRIGTATANGAESPDQASQSCEAILPVPDRNRRGGATTAHCGRGRTPRASRQPRDLSIATTRAQPTIFLAHRFGDGDLDLGALVSRDVVAFMEHVIARKTPYRDKTLSTHLRCFFQYLFAQGLTTSNLALCVPRVHKPWGSRLPRYLSPDEVEAVLASVATNPRRGARDHAMLLLMARLGMRAPEVMAVQLDDIDWRTGQILVRGKGQRHDRLPIPPDVGEAISTYLREERTSTTTRTLFVSHRAPNRPFKDSQIINSILREAFAATGVKPPTPYVGTHVLRHSLATNLVRSGASLDEIGDLLRHRSRATTMIYAKLDTDGLRSIAQPWPIAEAAR